MEERETPAPSDESVAGEAVTEEKTSSEAIVEKAEHAADAVVEQIQELDAVADVVTDTAAIPDPGFDEGLKALIEAVVYITDEPLTADQIARGLDAPLEKVEQGLALLVEEYSRVDRGLSIREVAGGYKVGTKPEHHEAIRSFVKNLKPSFKLSLAALETLAVIAYKQPITAPEIMEIRGVQGAGVLKTLLDRKLVTTAGRKAVIGKPILYKTTKEFLLQFGLNSTSELPSLKEFEELKRLAFSDDNIDEQAPAAAATETVLEAAIEAPETDVADPEEPTSEGTPASEETATDDSAEPVRKNG